MIMNTFDCVTWFIIPYLVMEVGQKHLNWMMPYFGDMLTVKPEDLKVCQGHTAVLEMLHHALDVVSKYLYTEMFN